MKISLKAARVNAGLTQMEAARELGIAPLTIVNWENGKHTPLRRKRQLIAVVYKTPMELIDWDNERTRKK